MCPGRMYEKGEREEGQTLGSARIADGIGLHYAAQGKDRYGEDSKSGEVHDL